MHYRQLPMKFDYGKDSDTINIKKTLHITLSFHCAPYERKVERENFQI